MNNNNHESEAEQIIRTNQHLLQKKIISKSGQKLYMNKYKNKIFNSGVLIMAIIDFLYTFKIMPKRLQNNNNE